MTHGLQVREREFAVLDVSPTNAEAGGRRQGAARRPSSPTASGRSPAAPSGRTARSGSSSASSIASTAGAPRRACTLERDASLDPVSLVVDKAGNLMVLSTDGPEGTVYSFKPGSPETETDA